MRELKIWILQILFLLKIFSVEADYRLEVRAHSYNNREGIDSQRYCCDKLSLFRPPCLLATCDNRFIFCLRPSGTARDPNPSNCPLGDARPTRVFQDTNQVDFPRSFDFSFTGESWPGSFQLLVNVEDAMIALDLSNDLIDNIYVEEGLSPGQSITRRAYTGALSIATITLSISLTCTSGFGPHCDDHHCQPLSDPDNGMVDQPTVIAQGSVATYTCNEGYNLIGDATRSCQSSGVWSGSPPICQPENLCEPLPNPASGMVQHPSTIVGGSVARYTCNDGYDLVGDTTRVCRSSGAWSHNPPICQPLPENLCQPLNNPVNGEVQQPGLIIEGSVATFSCNDGYELIGAVTLTCQSTGTWSDSPPICQLSQPDSTAITSFDTDTEQGLDLIIIIIIALAVAVSLLIGVIIIAIIVTITVCIIAKKRRQTRQQSSSSSQSEPHNYESYPGPPTPPYYARPLPLHNQDNTADIATGYSEAGHSETSFARNPAYIRMNKTTDYENIPYYTQIID